MLPVKTFRIPNTVITGSGSSKQVGEECKKLNLKKALIVTDQNQVKQGTLAGVTESLQRNDVHYAIYDGVNTEPVAEYVREGLEAFRETGAIVSLPLVGAARWTPPKPYQSWPPTRVP